MFERLKALAASYFVLAAGLQYNDPDPWAWIAIYAAAAAVSWWCRGRSRQPIPALLVGAFATLWALSLLPGAQGVEFLDLPQPMHTKGGAVEVAREVGGLGIVAVWMLALATKNRAALSRPGES